MKSREQSALEQKVLGFVRSNNLLPSGSRVVCALSGGADSVCLLLMLVNLAGVLSLQVEAAHVNHGIRGAEAERDELFCRDLCRRLNVPLQVFRGSAPALAERERRSLEDAARVLRYGFLNGLDCDRIAVAHNADDNLETVLWHLCRGSGARGLSGIPPVNGRIVRPCMCLTRAETEAYCRMGQALWVTDSTNETDDCTRNRIRHNVTPVLRRENPEIAGLVLASSLRLRQEDTYLDDLARRAYRENGEALTREFLDRIGPVLARRVLRLCAEEAGVSCDGDTTERIYRLSLQPNSRFTLQVPGGIYRGEYGRFAFSAGSPEENGHPAPEPVTVPTEPGAKGRLVFGREGAERTLTYERIPLQNEIIYKKFNTFVIECDKIKGTLMIRSCERDDLFRRNRGSGSKRLARVFSDLKMPAESRIGCPVVADDRGVLFVPGIGYNFMFASECVGGECIRLQFE